MRTVGEGLRRGTAWSFLLLLVLLAILAGCSGGGGGSAVGTAAESAAPIADERRMEILADVGSFHEGMTGTNSDDELLGLAHFLNGFPEVAGVAIAVDGSVWAVFTDGRLLVVADNRPRGGSIARPVDREESRGVPQAAEAHVANSFEFPGAFDSPVALVRDELVGKDYLVSEGAQVDDLRNLGTVGLLYMDAHGADMATAPVNGSRGLVLRQSPPPEFGLWTATDVTRQRDVLYRDDLNQRRLVYYVADTNAPDGSTVSETHYAITGRFVRAYMDFSASSFVFINACQSNSEKLRQACMDQGASVYAGWTDNVSDDLAYNAAAELYPSLAGTDSLAGMDLDAVVTHLHEEGLDEDLQSGARLVFTQAAEPFTFLAPILDSADQDSDGEPVVLRGQFGTEAGRVLVDGAEVPLQGEWDSQVLTIGDQPPQALQVAVEVRGHRSNEVALPAGQARFVGQYYGRHGGVDFGHGPGAEGPVTISILEDRLSAHFQVDGQYIYIFSSRQAPVFSGNQVTCSGDVAYCGTCFGFPGSFTAVLQADGETLVGTVTRDSSSVSFSATKMR